MATIVTVHGTFATGPEKGSAWWQEGGEFEADLRRLVEGADGRLDFVPHTWDGENSETSRRAAGSALAAKIDDLERRGTPYSIVGHSHGGSVVTSALLQRVARRRPLDKLNRWITVGTPFVTFSRKGLLFTRLGLFGKAAYVTFVTNLMLLATTGFLDNWASKPDVSLVFPAGFIVILVVINLLLGWHADRRMARAGVNLVSRASIMKIMPRMGILALTTYVIVFAIAAMILVGAVHQSGSSSPLDRSTRMWIIGGTIGFFIAFHVFMRWLGTRLAACSSIRTLASRSLADRHIGLWHEQDEAVLGLQQIRTMSLPIFGKGFAVGPLTFAAVMAIPALTLLAVLSPTFMNWLAITTNPTGFSSKIYANGALAGNGHDVVANMVLIWALPSTLAFPTSSSDKAAVMALTLSPLLYLTGALAAVALVKTIASFASHILAGMLDAITWSQLRASAYGSDTQGEVARVAAPNPPFIPLPPALPHALAAEISTAADAAAAASVSKLRRSIGQLAFAEADRPRADVVSEYLTWDELIHTAYFKVPRFNKLVAFAIANTEGFRPTATFRADPDFELLGLWFRSLSEHNADGDRRAIETSRRINLAPPAPLPRNQR